MSQVRFLAVDLGASSGRVVEGTLADGALSLREVHRFPNGPVQEGVHLTTDVDRLWRDVRDGLARSGPAPVAIGVVTWGVDFGLLDARGARNSATMGVSGQRTNLLAPESADQTPTK